MSSIFGDNKFDHTLGTLALMKAHHLQRDNRTAGWDRAMMSKIMRVIIEYKGGVVGDDLHMCFLDALYDMVEDDEAIAKIVNRVPVKSKIKESA